MTLEQVRQLAETLAAAGLPVSANKIVKALHGSKRDALRHLRTLRAETPVTVTVTDITVIASPPEPPVPLVEKPLHLCRRCGMHRYFEWCPGVWRCELCGIDP